MNSKGVMAVPIQSTNESLEFEGSDCQSANTRITMNLRSPKRSRTGCHFSSRSLTGFSEYTPKQNVQQPKHNPYQPIMTETVMPRDMQSLEYYLGNQGQVAESCKVSILYKDELLESGSDHHIYLRDMKSSSISEALSEDNFNISQINRSYGNKANREERIHKKLETCFIKYEQQPSEDSLSDIESESQLR